MKGEIVELTGSTFAEMVDSSEKLVIVEFYTVTCPNCSAMEPVFRDLAAELAEVAVFAKLNAQLNQEVAANYGVMGVPTFKFFCKGRPVGEDIGAMPATLLRNTIKDLVRRKTECIARSTPIVYEMDGYG